MIGTSNMGIIMTNSKDLLINIQHEYWLRLKVGYVDYSHYLYFVCYQYTATCLILTVLLICILLLHYVL
jgi:hypothetical protein